MALRFGNTTRLHHIDFPGTSTESAGPQTGNQAIQNSTVTQPEVKRPTATPGGHSKTGKVNLRVRKRQEKEITRKAQERSVQSLSSTPIKSENLNTSGSCGQAQEGLHNRSAPAIAAITQQAGVCYMNLTVEWDVLDSFSEFAAFLEVQNPICPAHLIDTPEKLLSVLSCEI